MYDGAMTGLEKGAFWQSSRYGNGDAALSARVAWCFLGVIGHRVGTMGHVVAAAKRHS